MSSTRAATQMRAVTAAPGVHPASMSPHAHAPDMPNDSAAAMASGSPRRTPRADATATLSSLTLPMIDDATRARCKMST